MIEEIEKIRGSRVIVYVTADRPDAGAKMGIDVGPYFYEHLDAMGHQDRLDLFLYTRGGFTLAPTRLAYLLREFCDEFAVLVPRHAHSAGTTLAMAADQIVMHRMGELGPIDPSVTNEFNPVDPQDPDGNRRVPISVEDVNAYLNLAKKQAGVPDSSMGEVFGRLAHELHPLALGNVHRQYLLIRSMSQRLLETHMDPEKEADEIEHILDVLTEKLYFHAYPLSRTEARDYVRLPVVFADSPLEAEMWKLYSSYETALGFGMPLVDAAQVTKRTRVEADSAVIESGSGLHTFRHSGWAEPQQQKQGPPQVQLLLQQLWARRA